MEKFGDKGRGRLTVAQPFEERSSRHAGRAPSCWVIEVPLIEQGRRERGTPRFHSWGRG